MKNMITIIPCILLLMACLAQFTCNQIVHNRMAFAEREVNAFVEIAKQEGCLTQTNIHRLKERMSRGLHMETGEIEVRGTGDIVERGTMISYYVSYPLDNTIAAAAVWGMDDTFSTQVLSGRTASEFVSWHQ